MYSASGYQTLFFEARSLTYQGFHQNQFLNATPDQNQHNMSKWFQDKQALRMGYFETRVLNWTFSLMPPLWNRLLKPSHLFQILRYIHFIFFIFLCSADGLKFYTVFSGLYLLRRPNVCSWVNCVWLQAMPLFKNKSGRMKTPLTSSAKVQLPF